MRGPAVPGLFALLALVVAAGSCTGEEADQPVVPARPGAYQPPGGGDAILEDDACQRLVDAEEASRKRLQCQPLGHPECPDYVRPAGTGCWRYDEETVEACERFVRDYTSCSDFDDRPCVLTAIPAPDVMCPPLGGGGAGGETGDAGAGGRDDAGAGGEGGRDDAGAGGVTASGGQAGGGEGGGSGSSGTSGTSGGAGESGAGGTSSGLSGSGGEGGS